MPITMPTIEISDEIESENTICLLMCISNWHCEFVWAWPDWRRSNLRQSDIYINIYTTPIYDKQHAIA